jgi:AraC-like DNA-binding protein
MDESDVTQQVEIRLFLRPLADVTADLCYIRRLERAWQLIKEDYADRGLSLEKAARASGANKNHLNALFRQTTPFTFHQFLRVTVS